MGRRAAVFEASPRLVKQSLPQDLSDWVIQHLVKTQLHLVDPGCHGEQVPDRDLSDSLIDNDTPVLRIVVQCPVVQRFDQALL